MVRGRVVPILITMAFLLCPATSSHAEFITCGKTVRYLIRDVPTDPMSDVVFIVRLKLEAEDSTASSVGWRIEAAEFRQPDSGGSPDTVWLEIVPSVDTADGLWWCDHADLLDPQMAEFAMPPELSGTAIAIEASDPNLLYFVSGSLDILPSSGPPHQLTAGLDYSFTKQGDPEPEEEGDDEPVEIEDEEEPRIPGGSFWGEPVNGLAVQPFVDGVIGGEADIGELPCFIVALLGGDCGCPRPGLYDCNANGDVDELDILLGVSADCNENGVPDECEIDSQSQAPGGPFYCTESCDPDCSENGVPDSCEVDCNDNLIPDECDIATCLSSDTWCRDCNENDILDGCEEDCNENLIPDECDIATCLSSDTWCQDCNENGIPDGCEEDCNGNYVPDDCDLDPTDPDGNGNVSEDCNQNQYPDECDLTLPLFPSFDCNNNLIPDECDLANCLSSDPSCQDCNANGFLDGCDIDSGISQDMNESGIPDECEQQQMMGGGGLDMETIAGSGSEIAWAEFHEWSFSRAWGPPAGTCGAAQFQATVEKLESLGLPVQDPFLRWPID